MSLSASMPDVSLEAAGADRIGRPHALFGIAKTPVAPITCAATKEIEMYQQPSVYETLPSQGDAINKLFAENYKASLRTAKRILHSKEDSEDAVQTAYCAAFRHFHRFRGESSFKTWITRIVVNCCLMQSRHRRARPQVSLDSVDSTVASHAATPEVLCYLAELQNAHASAASRLPKVLHDVYAESVISGVALPKVADQLGLTANAVKSRLFRGRRKVEHALQPVIQRRAAC
jgi:RNA polymerase sigma-70 factor, ECF subfamily